MVVTRSRGKFNIELEHVDSGRTTCLLEVCAISIEPLPPLVLSHLYFFDQYSTCRTVDQRLRVHPRYFDSWTEVPSFSKSHLGAVRGNGVTPRGLLAVDFPLYLAG